MRPHPGTVLHFSEDPTIVEFLPHVAATSSDPEPVVWAVDADRAPDYWFPRARPRALAWATSTTTDEDRRTILAVIASTAGFSGSGCGTLDRAEVAGQTPVASTDRGTSESPGGSTTRPTVPRPRPPRSPRVTAPGAPPPPEPQRRWEPQRRTQPPHRHPGRHAEDAPSSALIRRNQRHRNRQPARPRSTRLPGREPLSWAEPGRPSAAPATVPPQSTTRSEPRPDSADRGEWRGCR